MNPSARWLSTAPRLTAPPPSWTPSPATSATPRASRATSRRTPRNAKTTTSSSWTSPPPRRPSPPPRAAFKTRLHADELGAFWVTSRGTDRYVSAARSPFARDREDLWKLLPERSGPLGKILQPDFDNPDDPLCLVYSCVNDPRAPPSIDVLYALKLLDEGLATEGVTATGLLANAEDAAEKLQAYVRLVDAEANPELRDDAWRNPAPARGWGRVGI